MYQTRPISDNKGGCTNPSPLPAKPSQTAKIISTDFHKAVIDHVSGHQPDAQGAHAPSSCSQPSYKYPYRQQTRNLTSHKQRVRSKRHDFAPTSVLYSVRSGAMIALPRPPPLFSAPLNEQLSCEYSPITTVLISAQLIFIHAQEPGRRKAYGYHNSLVFACSTPKTITCSKGHLLSDSPGINSDSVVV
jgi:hypothetical protein